MNTWKTDELLPNLIRKIKQSQKDHSVTSSKELGMEDSDFKQECLCCPVLNQCIKAKNIGQ